MKWAEPLVLTIGKHPAGFVFFVMVLWIAVEVIVWTVKS